MLTSPSSRIHRSLLLCLRIKATWRESLQALATYPRTFHSKRPAAQRTINHIFHQVLELAAAVARSFRVLISTGEGFWLLTPEVGHETLFFALLCLCTVEALRSIWKEAFVHHSSTALACSRVQSIIKHVSTNSWSWQPTSSLVIALAAPDTGSTRFKCGRGRTFGSRW
ncbi:hypothetical protein BDV98DRAFT_115827 [Pterulicium gracile]|uniref:Uncharacterized protein n=1 Tax=Pterulicium gracile TaxID=1884261 RepID=A0A5C3QEC9_9AGAR|nr:hypothetical protein BDV98DRAFT_115827 [Pterula gracilis]